MSERVMTVTLRVTIADWSHQELRDIARMERTKVERLPGVNTCDPRTVARILAREGMSDFMGSAATGFITVKACEVTEARFVDEAAAS